MSRFALRRATLFLVSALGVLAIFAPSAFAKPTINVEAPSGVAISLTTANPPLTINPNGGTTYYWIEYGKTKQYGNSTPHIFVGKGESPVTLYPELVGLEGMTTYHFRVVASGEVTSPDVEFENLNDWKVGTRRATKLFFPLLEFQDSSLGQLEFQGEIEGHGTRVTCSPQSKASGVLGVSISNIKYNCGVTVIGVGGCASTESSTLKLDGQLAQTEPFVVKFPAGCVAGTSLSFFRGGLRVPQSPQAKEFTSELWGVSYTGTEQRWDVRLAPESWSLTGAEAGGLFGVGL
jgi:hypothetical protein